MEQYLQDKNGSQWDKSVSLLHRYMDAGLVEKQEIAVSSTTPRERKYYWKVFNRSAQNKHYQHVAKTEPKALIRMGVNPHAIAFVQENGLKNIDRNPQLISRADQFNLFATIHLRPIYFGGNNDQDNLCEMPIALGKIKNRIERVQKSKSPDAETIITLAPTRKTNGEQRIWIPNLPLRLKK